MRHFYGSGTLSTSGSLVPAPVRTLAHRLAGLEVVFAASLPLTALQAVGTEDGDTVLVHAAAGGVCTSLCR